MKDLNDYYGISLTLSPDCHHKYFDMLKYIDMITAMMLTFDMATAAANTCKHASDWPRVATVYVDTECVGGNTVLLELRYRLGSSRVRATSSEIIESSKHLEGGCHEQLGSS